MDEIRKALQEMIDSASTPEAVEMAGYMGVLACGWEYILNVDPMKFKLMRQYALDEHGLTSVSFSENTLP